jgi:hypothetical protein
MSRASTLLLVNGIVLGAMATAQFVLDFVGYFTGLGPMGAALLEIRAHFQPASRVTATA